MEFSNNQDNENQIKINEPEINESSLTEPVEITAKVVESSETSNTQRVIEIDY